MNAKLGTIPEFLAAALDLHPDVVMIAHDGCVRLLDLRRCRFFALDAIGSQLLQHSLRGPTEQAVRAIASRFGVSQAQVAADWQKLADQLVVQRLVTRRRAAPAVTLPSVWWLWCLLTMAWLSVRCLNWQLAIEWWRVPSDHRGQYAWRRSELAAYLADFDQRLRQVAARHILNPECKELALVSWRQLRSDLRLPVELKLGVNPYPFQAHAWVECAGLVISDDAESCAQYRIAKTYS